MSKRKFAEANPDREKSKGKQKRGDSPVELSQKAQQTSLSAFFGNEIKEKAPRKVDFPRPRGFREIAAMPQEFPESKADIWSWNINGINATLEKGTLVAFLKEHDP